MDVLQTTQVQAPTAEFERCDACDAPVDRQQRYCVSCGAHRLGVPDPAARYLALASARARAGRAGRSGVRAGERRVPLLLIALVLLAIPVAVAVGVLVGHSGASNSKLNGKILQALQHPAKAQVVDVGGNTGSTGTSGTTGSSSGSKHHGHSGGSKSASGSSSKVAPKVGARATKAEEKTGAAVAKKVQSSKGKSYVDGQSSLPNSVVVP